MPLIFKVPSVYNTEIADTSGYGTLLTSPSSSRSFEICLEFHWTSCNGDNHYLKYYLSHHPLPGKGHSGKYFKDVAAVNHFIYTHRPLY